PSRGPLPAVPGRDVGALLLLWHARPAGPLSRAIRDPGPRRFGTDQPGPRLVACRRQHALRMVHRTRVPPADRRRPRRRPLPRHAPLGGGGGAADRARSPRARRLPPRRPRAQRAGHDGVRARPRARRDRNGTLQAVRLRDGRTALSARRRAPRRRVHHLLHGDQPGSLPVSLRLRHAGRARRLALGLRLGRGWGARGAGALHPPAAAPARRRRAGGSGKVVAVTLAGGAAAAVAFAALYHAGAIAGLAAGTMRLATLFGRPWLLPTVLAAGLVAAVAWFVGGLPSADRGPTVTI